jgi:aspartate aminotransferase
MKPKTTLAGRVAQLKPSPTLAITSKAKEMRKNGVDVVSFGAGEPDFDTPVRVKRAGIRAIEKGFTKYTPASGTLDLKKAICRKLKSDNGLDYAPQEVIVSSGAKHALYNIFQVLCEKGDEVLVISPYWVSYPEMIRLSGAQPRMVPSAEERGFEVDPAAIKKALSKRTKVIIVNSPSNPTGAVFSERTLKSIARVAVEHDLIVVSDEIYEKLVYGSAKHVSIGSFNKEIFRRTLTVNGVSKAYSMTGWRIGYVAGPRACIAKMGALQSHSTSNPCSISQAAALEAITAEKKSISTMRRAFLSRRDYMVGRINRLKGVSCTKPKGAFYLFCNVAGTGFDSVSLCSRLLDDAHVACVPGIAFGSDRHIRLSFATDMETIKKGLARIERWLDRNVA